MGTEDYNEFTSNFDLLSTLEMAKIMNQEDKKVPLAIEKVLPDIARAIDIIVDSFRKCGRLFYVGAGTSGRLGILDAAECPPTFSVDPEMIQGIIAGGEKAITSAVEYAEDDIAQGREEIIRRKISENDVVVGITASGTTPFVISALKEAHNRGAKTILITNNYNSPAKDFVDIAIEIDTGPEVIAGSTRLKAGTSQKLVLNMFSTISMAKLGKVYGNIMVDVKPTNQKLVNRAVRIIKRITGATEDIALERLKACNMNVKEAIVSIIGNLSPIESKKLLEESNYYLRTALEKLRRITQ
ncbi:MAG: N-acetylmuramic acid 6-phosphate etherase [bacterium]|nr:N-acetylmuramic acid 6-phosphate etherase [bacterium]